MSALALPAVAVGFHSALNQSSLTAVADGPHDALVPQKRAFPIVWFVLSEDNARGLGRGGLRRIDARVHAAADSGATGAAARVRAILAVVVGLLEDATLTISGYRQGGEIFYGVTTDPIPSELNGVPCLEAVSNFYFWVEPT